jgi:hypothetical protein
MRASSAQAEEYYRSMYLRGVSTWNLRGTHMMDVLDALAAHLQRLGRRSARERPGCCTMRITRRARSRTGCST